MKALKSAALVEAVLADYRTAPIDDKLRATLGFLEKLTLQPADVSPADVAPLRAAGVSDAAAREAIYVAMVFGVIDRLADVFDFKVNDERGLKWVARILLGIGYRAGSVPG